MVGFLRNKTGMNAEERTRIERVFSKVVSSEMAKEMLDETSVKTVEPRPTHLGLVLAWAGGADVCDVAAGVRDVVSIAARHEATVWSITGPLVVLSVGPVRENQAPFDPEALRRFVADLTGLGNARLKVVHGHGTAHVGLFGSENGVCLYSFVAPRFEEMLAALMRAEAGQVVEVDLG